MAQKVSGRPSASSTAPLQRGDDPAGVVAPAWFRAKLAEQPALRERRDPILFFRGGGGRKVMYDNVPAEALEEFRRLRAKQAQARTTGQMARTPRPAIPGAWNGSTLIASKIEFKHSVIRLQGTTANRDTVAQTFDLQIAASSYMVKIELDSLTSGLLPADGLACVQVRGQRKTPAAQLTVTAGEINTSCSNSNRHFIQAPVEAESPEIGITLLGFPLDVSKPTDILPFVDVNGQSITRGAFFTAVAPAATNEAGIPVPGTLVKVIFDDGTNAVRQAELED